MGGKPLGYNIRYVTSSTGKSRKAYYEISPGVWVPRSQIPENIEYRKRTYDKRRAKDFEYLNSERGYMRSIFGTSRKSARKKNHSFEFTWEEWWQHWLKKEKAPGETRLQNIKQFKIKYGDNHDR